MSNQEKNQTLYDHAGGWDALYKHVGIFYRSCLADPVLQPLFGTVEQPGHIEKFTAFTAETFGGTDKFTKDMGGFLHLIDVHRGYKISEEQRQRFVDLYLVAADEAGLPADKPFREALKSHVDFGSHVAKQNSNANSDEELHPLREVPKWNWNPDQK
ncbi:MAG: group II truncated hemoglobin [Chitinophagaceae bacterium]